MITPEEVKAIIENAMPGANAVVEDMRGTGDHFDILVTSPVFAGKTLIEQHQLVFQALEEAMNGPVHAVQLKTKVS